MSVERDKQLIEALLTTTKGWRPDYNGEQASYYLLFGEVTVVVYPNVVNIQATIGVKHSIGDMSVYTKAKQSSEELRELVLDNLLKNIQEAR